MGAEICSSSAELHTKVRHARLSTTVCAVFSEVTMYARPPHYSTYEMDHSRPPRTRRARGGVSPQSRPSPHSGASRCVPSAHGTPRMKRLSAGVCRGTLTAMPVLDCASRRKKKACRQPVHDDRVVHGETRSATHLKVGNTPEGSLLRTARAHTASSVNGWWQALCRWMVRQPLLFCALHHKQGHGFRHHR